MSLLLDSRRLLMACMAGCMEPGFGLQAATGRVAGRCPKGGDASQAQRDRHRGGRSWLGPTCRLTVVMRFPRRTSTASRRAALPSRICTPQSYYDRFSNIEDPIRRTYVAMIAALDDGVGRVLQALEEQGVRDDTMVVFMSDNGCPVQFGFCDCSHSLGAGKSSSRTPLTPPGRGRLTTCMLSSRPRSRAW